MKVERCSFWNKLRCGGRVVPVFALAAVTMFATPHVRAQNNWDGQAGNGLWFDPVNWGFDAPGATAPFYLPPSTGNPYQSREAVISASPGGEGVIFDPLGVDAANYAAAAGPNYVYPTAEDSRFDRDTFWRFYISTSAATANNKVTLKSGTMHFIDKAMSVDAMGVPNAGSLNGTIIIGRGGATPGIQGWLVQEGGSFITNEVALDIGHFQTNVGNGFYEYKGGILEVSLISDSGLRLGHGGSTGPAGNGTLIVHNSDQPGYIRTWILNVGSGLGQTGTSSNGSGTLEFHADFNGTRPIQVLNNLSINHQDDTSGTTGNKRSAVLKLVLDEAPELLAGGVPINLGLIDVNSDGDAMGDIVGVTDDALDPFVGEDDIFYSNTWDNGGLPLPEGSIISADFGSTRYRWTLSYNGEITWVDQNTGEVASVTADLNNPESANIDVVLIGLDSMSIGVPGDYNGDGQVDAGDYVRWRNNLGDPDETDINSLGDGGGVTISDYTYWKDRYGDPGAGGGGIISQVPEPSAATLLLLALAGVIGRVYGSRRQ